MFSLLAIWLYMLFVIFVLGDIVFSGLEKKLYINAAHKDGLSNALILRFLTGVVVVTVYAQTFSLFYKVGIKANILLIIVTLFVFVYRKNHIKHLLRKEICDKRVLVTAFIGVLLVLPFAAGANQVYDTYLYHAQAVRWIEEFGCVKGVANLLTRIGFNSSSFALDALFSMKNIGVDQSFRPVNSLLAFIAILFSVSHICKWRKHAFHMSDMLCAGCILYILLIIGELSSLSTDAVVNLGLFLMMIIFLDYLERNEREAFPYAMLCIFELWLITVKLSTAVIIVNAVLPIYYLLRSKKWKEIGLYFGLGLVVIIPYFARNLVVSGWLLYPSTLVKVYDFEWLVPVNLVDRTANYIYSWARIPGAGFEDTLYGGFLNWFPVWLQNLGRDYVIGFSWVAFLLVVSILYSIFYKKGQKVQGLNRVGIFIFFISTAGAMIFWFFTAPNIRFAIPFIYVWLFSFPAYLIAVMNPGVIRKIVCLGMIYIMVVFSWNIARSVRKCVKEILIDFSKGIWKQIDYDIFPTEVIRIDGIEIYYPIEGDDRPGYYAFPASENTRVRLLGDSLEDGFYSE